MVLVESWSWGRIFILVIKIRAEEFWVSGGACLTSKSKCKVNVPIPGHLRYGGHTFENFSVIQMDLYKNDFAITWGNVCTLSFIKTHILGLNNFVKYWKFIVLTMAQFLDSLSSMLGCVNFVGKSKIVENFKLTSDKVMLVLILNLKLSSECNLREV